MPGLCPGGMLKLRFDRYIIVKISRDLLNDEISHAKDNFIVDGQ